MYVVVVSFVFPGSDQFVQIQGDLKEQTENEEERQDQAWISLINLLDDEVTTEVGGDTSFGHNWHYSIHHL